MEEYLSQSLEFLRFCRYMLSPRGLKKDYHMHLTMNFLKEKTEMIINPSFVNPEGDLVGFFFFNGGFVAYRTTGIESELGYPVILYDENLRISGIGDTQLSDITFLCSRVYFAGSIGRNGIDERREYWLDWDNQLQVDVNSFFLSNRPRFDFDHLRQFRFKGFSNVFRVTDQGLVDRIRSVFNDDERNLESIAQRDPNWRRLLPRPPGYP